MNERLLVLAASELAGGCDDLVSARGRITALRDYVFGLLKTGGTFAQIEKWKAYHADCDAWLAAADRLEEQERDRAEHDRVKALVEDWCGVANESSAGPAWKDAHRACAKQLAAALTEPTDEPISDPAERAKLVAKELRRRGIHAKDSRADIVDQNIVAVLGFEDPRSHHGRLGCQWSIELYRLREQPFADMATPIAIADRIQAEEAKRAKAWTGDE